MLLHLSNFLARLTKVTQKHQFLFRITIIVSQKRPIVDFRHRSKAGKYQADIRTDRDISKDPHQLK